MYTPSDPRTPTVRDEYTWKSILLAYAALGAVPLLLWTLHRPLAGVLAITALAGLVAAGRPAARLARCFRNCGGFAVDLGDRVRISVSQPCPDCTP